MYFNQCNKYCSCWLFLEKIAWWQRTWI